MVAVLDDPAIRARAHSVSVQEYHAWIAAGIAPPQVELLRGAVVEKRPKSPLHSSIVTRLFKQALAIAPAGTEVRSEQPLTFRDSEPEPDLAIVRGTADDFVHAHPKSALLIVEVVISSEATDRLKAEIYAEAGVREYWLAFAEERRVERHTEPVGRRYGRVEHATFPASLESTVVPGFHLPGAELFPARA